jgi:alginate O-acetyltransferase complex protein AlgI
VSILVNYGFGSAIKNSKPGSKQAKILLICGIAINLALIGYYKYAGFLLKSVNYILNIDLPIPQIILPLAISFYTFTQIAYLVDTYRQEAEKYDFLKYSLFVTFFPQLIAGPILRHHELIPELNQTSTFSFSHKNLAMGLTLFVLGLSKKMLIADTLSPWVAEVFNNPNQVSFIEVWVGALCYTFQLYFDFSGYSDMAVGLGWMFNIHLPINFNSPYKAESISDFWRRWHITLSNFLRDYLYIPLGGNRQGKIRRYINLLITMLLGGLWHGAGWTFVVWGGLHGMYLVIHHQWRQLNLKIPSILSWLITLLAVVFSWVLFRANNFKDAMTLLQTMVGINGIILPGKLEGILSGLIPLGVKFEGQGILSALPHLPGDNPTSLAINLIFITVLLVVVTSFPNTMKLMEKFSPTKKWALAISLLGVTCLISLNKVSEFLYFQF